MNFPYWEMHYITSSEYGVNANVKPGK